MIQKRKSKSKSRLSISKTIMTSRPRFTIYPRDGKIRDFSAFPWGGDFSPLIIRKFNINCLNNNTEKSGDGSEISFISYLSNGKYGMTYRVRFHGQRAVLKLVPIDFIHPPLEFKTSLKSFQKEEEILQTVGDANVGPRIYKSGICNVELWDDIEKKYLKTVKMGFIIMQYFDVHLKRIANDAVDMLEKQFTKKVFLQFLNFFRKIDEDILNDVRRSIYQLDIFPKDLHRENILYDFDSNQAKIVDWGMSKFLTPKSDSIPESIPQFPKPRNPNGSNILEMDGFYYTHRYLLDLLKLKNLKNSQRHLIKTWLKYGSNNNSDDDSDLV